MVTPKKRGNFEIDHLENRSRSKFNYVEKESLLNWSVRKVVTWGMIHLGKNHFKIKCSENESLRKRLTSENDSARNC